MAKKGQLTKEKILAEAVELFHEFGYANATTRQLVGRLGMTSSAIYFHFSNKEEILFSIIKNAGDKVLITLNEAVENNDDPVKCLQLMISGMLSLFSSGGLRKDIAIFIDELYQLPEDLRKICNMQHRQIFKLFQAKINEIESSKNGDSINPTVASFGVIGAILWVYHWFRDNGELSMEQVSGELIKLLFKGIT